MTWAVLIVARAVPVLLALSLMLVAGRYVHDLSAKYSRLVARSLFAAILVVGCSALIPYGQRSIARIRAEHAVVQQRWADVDRHFEHHRNLGGNLGTHAIMQWVKSLTTMHRWRDAEQLLLETIEITDGTFEASPRAVVLLGVCRYYQNQLDWAEKTFRAVPDDPDGFLRDYFLARIEYRRGHTERAENLYRASLAQQQLFFPALYNLSVMLLRTGRGEMAAELIQTFGDSVADSPPPDGFDALVEAASDGAPVPDDKEFVIVLL